MSPVSIEMIMSGTSVALISVIGYFLRKIDMKIEETAKESADLKERILNIRDELKEDMIEVFNIACHERQAACAKVQDLRACNIDSQLRACCEKLKAHMQETERRQERQDKINEKVLGHVYRANGTNSGKDGGR